LEPENFTVLEGIIRCAQPWTEAQVVWLYQRGVRAIVSLEPLDADLVNLIRMLGIRHLVLDVPDMKLPTPEQVAVFLEFMDEVHRDGAVAIHCALGNGRSGTMYALWLVGRGVDPEDAIRRAGSLETEEQKEFVRAFGRSLCGWLEEADW